MIELFTDLVEKWRGYMREEFGDDVNTGDNSNFYKVCYPILEELFNKYNTVQDFIDNKYIYTANGIWLDRFLSNYNFIRKQATTAVTTWTTTDSTPFSFVAVGALQVKDSLENTFVNTEAGNVDGTGALTIAIESIEKGESQNVQAGTLTEIITPVSGINTGANLNDATGGQDQETDSEFRERFLRGRAGKGYWNIDGITRALLELDGVESAICKENDKNFVVDGLNPHSIICIVDGGTDQEIGQTIFEKSDQAIERMGNTLIVVKDLNNEDKDIYFERPYTTVIELEYNYTGTVNVSDLETNLVKYTNDVGIGGTLSAYQASDFLTKKIDMSGVISFSVGFRRFGGTTYISTLQLFDSEKPDGVII